MSCGISHQVGVKASPDEIYKDLTETTKLAQWWTTDTRGSGAKADDTLELWFSGFCQQCCSCACLGRLGQSLIMKGETSYFESKPTTGLFIDAERTKVESNVVPITG